MFMDQALLRNLRSFSPSFSGHFTERGCNVGERFEQAPLYALPGRRGEVDLQTGSNKDAGFMPAFLSVKSRKWISLPAFVAILFAQHSPSQTSRSERAGLSSIADVEESSRFIVAFELTEENGFKFTWPFEPMRPSSYETVVMVVDKMPRVRNEINGGEAEALFASRDLKVNGRRQKPTRITNGRAYFIVKLDQGRLRLSLSIPAGMSLGLENKLVRIKLYRQ